MTLQTPLKVFTSIVIAGGADKVLAAIGVVKFLEEHKMLSNIINLVGTSAGAVLCTFIALGYSSTEIAEFFRNNLCMDESIKKIPVEDILNIFTTYGMCNGENLMIFFKRMLINKLGDANENISFIEFAKVTGKNLVICVSNLSKEQHEFWSVDNKPDMPIITALRVSCSIPILFTPIVLEDEYFIDGGVFNNFPIDYFNHNNTLKDILGINIKSTGYQDTSSFMKYMSFIMCSTIGKLTSKNWTEHENANVICLEFQDESWLSWLDMSICIPPEKINHLSQIGYQSIKEKLHITYGKWD